MKTEQEGYTSKSRIRALRIFDYNNFNYLRTEKLTGIFRFALNKREAQYSKEVFIRKSPAELALKAVDTEMGKNDIKIIKSFYYTRQLKRDFILGLVPKENKLEILAKVLKVVSAEMTLNAELGKLGTNPGMNFLQAINKQFEEIDWLNQKVGHYHHRPMDLAV